MNPIEQLEIINELLKDVMMRTYKIEIRKKGEPIMAICPHCGKEIGIILSEKGNMIEHQFAHLQHELGMWREKYEAVIEKLKKLTGEEEE